MDESVTDSFTASPVECLSSPLLRVSAAAWPFYWSLAASHNSDTITCSYCTRCRGTSQPLGPVLCVSLPNLFLFLARLRAYVRVMTFLWAFKMQRASFLFLSEWKCENPPAIACFCAFIRQWESVRAVHLILPPLPQDCLVFCLNC